MEHLTSVVTWDQLIQLGIFLAAILNLIYIIFRDHHNKK